MANTDDYSFDGIRSFIQEKGSNPFCLFVMSTNPHIPWTMGDPSEFDADKLVLPPHWVDTKDIRADFRKYLAEVRRLDNQVGELAQLLKTTGLEDNTIFIFLGEQGAQFPGGKWNLWENGQSSSMIVRWPGRIKAGRETNAICQYEDILPTLVEAAGGKPDKGLDGISFLPALLEKAEQHRTYAYGIHNNVPEGPPYPIRSIRTDRYKLILNLLPETQYHNRFMMDTMKVKNYWATWLQLAENSVKARTLTNRILHRPPLEFYDLKKDPYELNNLAAGNRHAAIREKMLEELNAWMKAQGDAGALTDKKYRNN